MTLIPRSTNATPATSARTLTRRFALAGTAAILTAGSALASAAPARAATVISVTSSCNKLIVKAPGLSSGRTGAVITDRGSVGLVAGRGTVTASVPAGSYSWLGIDAAATDMAVANRADAARVSAARASASADTDDSAPVLASGRVVVAPCSSTSARRPVVGDETGDGRADVFALTTGGDLVYYRTSSSLHLLSGIHVGHGWGSTDWIGRLTEQGLPDSDPSAPRVANKLIAHRVDGTVWMYSDLGGGRVQSGVQIGSGLVGYTNFAVTQTNSPQSFTGHALTAVKDGQRHMWFLDPETQKLVADDDDQLDTATTAVTTTYMPRLDADPWADEIDIDPAGVMRWVNHPNPNSDTASVRQIGHGWGIMQAVASPGDMDGDGYSDIIARRADGNLYVYRATGSATWKAPVQIGANWKGVKVLG